MSKTTKSPSILDALIPISALIIMLIASVSFYGSDSSYGANQIALILAAFVAIMVGFKNGYTWHEIEGGIVNGISVSLGAILILLTVGSLIGTWILAGTVPTMIYYGLHILDPSYFYAAACLICALVSLSIGSSWTTAGTVGVALIGISGALDMSIAITAGAIISGAYFGDKMSPLSDTTNLAPAVAGTDLFTHIRHMTWTTGPSIIIALIIFFIIGLMHDTSTAPASMGTTESMLSEQFNITLFALIPLFLVLIMAFKQFPAFLTLIVGSLAGAIFALILQPATVLNSVQSSLYQCKSSSELISQCVVDGFSSTEQNTQLTTTLSLNDNSGKTVSFNINNDKNNQAVQTILDTEKIELEIHSRSHIAARLDAIWRAFFEGYKSETGNETIDNLLSRGGMSSMLNTVWLIICAMTFGAVLETIGLLQRIVESILKMAHSTGSLITSVIVTCIGTNIIAADQYIAIVLPGRMFQAEFKRRKLHPKNLSRVLEDSATITSPLIPWNTCGAYMAGVLGVPTLVYLPFCFFNLTNPFVSIIYGITNFKITRLDEVEESAIN
ncbi:MAG: Na+/H+ antiporter NhaC family protein [bacterium]